MFCKAKSNVCIGKQIHKYDKLSDPFSIERVVRILIYVPTSAMCIHHYFSSLIELELLHKFELNAKEPFQFHFEVHIY